MADVHPRRLTRVLTRAVIVAWTVLAAADVLAAIEYVPWMPGPLHGLAATGTATATVLAAWLRYQIPVRAAFLDGMLHERANPGGLKVQPLPMASGDDTGGGRVIDFQRPGSGVHRSRPAPHPRDPRRR